MALKTKVHIARERGLFAARDIETQFRVSHDSIVAVTPGSALGLRFEWVTSQFNVIQIRDLGVLTRNRCGNFRNELCGVRQLGYKSLNKLQESELQRL